MRGKRRKALISDFQRKTGESPHRAIIDRDSRIYQDPNRITKENPTGQFQVPNTKVIAESIVRKIKKGYKKRCTLPK